MTNWTATIATCTRILASLSLIFVRLFNTSTNSVSFALEVSMKFLRQPTSLLRKLTQVLRLKILSSQLEPARSPNNSEGSPEHDQFFRYTSGRWLYNENEQMRIRYTPFNVEALKQIATASAEAEHCVEMIKIAEGSFNKIFKLTFDNGTKLVAKIPFPLCVPRRLCTASEVATMDYARNVLGIPVPRVLSWTADADASEVGAEYILMEFVEGMEFYKREESLRGAVIHFLKQVITVECKFAQRRFSQIGSLYYKEDVSPALQTRPLYAEAETGDTYSDRFRIGPYVEWNGWRGQRSNMDVDRGPWPDALSYIKALVAIEKEWLRTFAAPRASCDIFRRSDLENSTNAHIRLLDDFLVVLPSIIPPNDLCAPVMWHTDLHAANIIVASEGQPDIVALVDWQGVSIGPLFLQATFAACLRYASDSRITIPPGAVMVPLPPNFESYSEEDKTYLTAQHRLAMIHKYYEISVKKSNPPYFASQNYPNIHDIISATSSACCTWYEGMHHLREALLKLRDAWDEISLGTPFPISWDADAIAKHEEEYPKLITYESCVYAVMKQLQLEGDGWVATERYNEVKKRNEKIMKHWNQELPWPYPFQEGGRSWFIS